MRFVFKFLLIFLLQRETFAQTSTHSLHTQQNNLTRFSIDHLNDVAFTIYLNAPDSARLIAEKALLLSEKAKYSYGIGRSFLNIGYVYWSQSYYPIALFYLNRALVSMPANQHLLISDIYNITGRTYADLKNYKKAVKNIDLSARFAGNDPGRLGEVYSQRAYIYMRTKNLNKAIAASKQALILNKIARDESNTAVLYGRLAGIYEDKKEFKIALAYADTAYSLSIKTQNKRLEANSYLDFAIIYNHLKDFDKASVFARRAVALASIIGCVDAISSAYKILIAVNEHKSNLVQALYYQKEYIHIRDSINAFEKIKNTELIQDYFVLNSRLNQIAAVERNNLINKGRIRTKNVIIITLSISLFIVIALLSITYYYYRQKELLSNQLHKQHDALVDQKQLIEAQTANLKAISKVKDKLLTVIGHDLRTPLASLQSIVEMFQVRYLSTDEVHGLMKDIGPLVKSAELTLSNLVEWAGNQVRGRGSNFSKLDVYLIGVEMEQTFIPALQRKGIEFLNNASPGQSAIADENHIKVVLRNLISNAIKFTENNGSITLISFLKDNDVIISVEDTGKGMSADEVNRLFYLQSHFSQPGTLGETGVGIGLLLCKELVELNGGKLWINSVEGKGSKFFFSLPLNPVYAKNMIT